MGVIVRLVLLLLMIEVLHPMTDVRGMIGGAATALMASNDRADDGDNVI
jgi:hypothetical protein